MRGSLGKVPIYLFHMTIPLYITVFYLAINLIAFLIMFWDKRKSVKPGEERISEGMMFFLASSFGAFGVCTGMFFFRHKTRKWYFLLGIPLLIIENISLAYVIYLLL